VAAYPESEAAKALEALAETVISRVRANDGRLR